MTDYGDFVSLALNAERVRSRNSLDRVRELRVADGREELPDDWIASVALTPEETSTWRRNELKLALAARHRG